MDKMKRHDGSRQSGFTMIEIIAVLIILGILAAFAVPRYFGMQEEAKKQAAQGAINEIKGRLNTAFSESMMENAGSFNATDVLSDATDGECSDWGCDVSDSKLGDFEYEITDESSGDTTMNGTIEITKDDISVSDNWSAKIN